MRYLLAVAFCFLTIAGSEPVWANTYQVDKAQASVTFNIRNFISNVQGTFHDFEGVVTYNPGQPETWTASGTIQAKSIDTKNSERDRHLLSKDFFDVEKFPTISFRMTKVSSAEKNSAQVEGFLKIHGIEKFVPIHVQGLVLGPDKNGVEHLTFTAAANINRKDFGMIYSSSGPGEMMLGDKVTITLQVDAIRKD